MQSYSILRDHNCFMLKKLRDVFIIFLLISFVIIKIRFTNFYCRNQVHSISFHLKNHLLYVKKKLKNIF